MSFFFEPKAGQDSLKIEGPLFEYIFKIRRTKPEEMLDFRNLQDDNLYTYQTQYIEKKSSTLKLISTQEKSSRGKGTHLAWCVVDPKTVEKTLPHLNELGVSKIDFIYSKRSQRNFIIKPERFESIIVSSCQQCGRSDMMNFEIFDSLEKWIKAQKSFFALDFGGELLPKSISNETCLIGPEGGFDEAEKALIANKAINTYALDTNLTLKSETACITIASRFV